MNTKSIDAIARAILYEGYMLYPYRPSSVKNRQRFNFGVLYPQTYSEAQTGSDTCSMQTECLVQGLPGTVVEVRVRFLKLVARSMGQPATPTEVSSQSWREATECEVVAPPSNLEALTIAPLQWRFDFPADEKNEPSPEGDGQTGDLIVRKQESVNGIVMITAQPVAEALFKLRVQVKNLTALDMSDISRDKALMRSLVSAHTLLGLSDGEFISLLEPPLDLQELATSCQNLGTWPVLVGDAGHRETMLSSPIILYDYPQIAPESPGDLFDGLEIDEILALRIMTMTDEEKREMRQADERSRRILERTENLPMEHLMKLHGTLRELRPFKEEMP